MKGWKSIFFTLLSAFFVWLFLRRVDFPSLLATWRTLPWQAPLLFALLMAPQYALRALRGGVLLRPFKPAIPFRSLWNFSLIGFLISYVLPGRLGEVVRPLLLAEKEGIKKSQAIATIVNERLLDLLTILVLFAGYLLAAAGAPSPLLGRLRAAALWLLPLVFAAFLLIFLANHPRVFPWTERLLRGGTRLLPRRWREPAAGFLLHFIRALRLDLSAPALATVSLLSLLHWGLIAFSYWLLLNAFAAGIAPAQVIPFLAVIFVSAAVPTPGMAGSLDLAAAYALSGLYGMDGRTAAAFTLLFHFLVLAVPIALGLAALWREGLSFRILGRLRGDDELPAMR